MDTCPFTSGSLEHAQARRSAAKQVKIPRGKHAEKKLLILFKFDDRSHQPWHTELGGLGSCFMAKIA